MKKTRYLIFLSLLATIQLNAQKLTLGELFNEGAVLQRNAPVTVWGKAAPSENVTVSIQDQQATAKCDQTGRWETLLPALKEGGPYALKVRGQGDSVCLKEVYVGEVWIAGGQSNMGFTLDHAKDAKEHMSHAVNKNIRFVMVPVLTYEGDKTKGDMNWRTATTENVGPMSAVAYFFAKDLQEKLRVPVGIICCYKGGTAAEVWMSRETLLKNPEHAPIVEAYDRYINRLDKNEYEELYSVYEAKMKLYADSLKSGFDQAIHPVEPMGDRNYKRPCVLYDFMLKRIIPYTSKGVIWYQGEANASRAEQYRTLFPALIEEWRQDFRNQNLPFLFVQLSNYDHPSYGTKPAWAELREAQLLTWKNVKNTAMVVTMDVGTKNNLHPINKEPVGDRLAACAFHTVYGMNVPYSGPVYKSTRFNASEAILSFDFIYEGLRSDGTLKGFTICGKDQNFVPAKAVIQDNRVVVSSEKVSNPVAVRYNWSNWAEGDLKNSAGFPATPFRTDDFKLQTSGVKAPKY